MEKNKTSIVLLLSLFFICIIYTACEEQVLDKLPKDRFTDAAVWNDESLIEMYVTDIFTGVNAWSVGMSGRGLRAFGDLRTGDIYDYKQQQGIVTWYTGNYSSSSSDFLNQDWRDNYRYIRKCNLFLEKITEGEGISESKKNRWIAEVQFLRTYYYHKLVAYFGGVPLITDVFGKDDNFQIPRDSYEDCIDFIIAELDAALENLPDELSSDEVGRINKAAAYAQKSITLLYANSALHDPNESEAPRGSLYDYTKNTMQDAADAAKAVIDMTQFNLPEVADFKEYQRLFIEQNSEQIWVKVHSSEFHDMPGRLPERNLNSPGFFGWGTHVPTHNFVQSFQMANGKSIDDPESGYDPSPEHIYDNREMRFYSNILYHGCQYRGREMKMHLPDGIDYKNNTQPWNGSITRYYQRKICDENLDFSSNVTSASWPMFRLAEIYLNYAEANYFLGNEEITHEYINKVRERVKLPPLDPTLTGEALLDAIVYERHMELHNEHHRFFDVRRWLIADETENEDLTGIEWFRVKLSFDPATEDMRNEDNWVDMSEEGKYVYREIVVQERNHPKRQLYLPIPKSELQKDPELEQNQGYENL
jgi:starch-binding outer membrane protein, SusD/RagB family